MDINGYTPKGEVAAHNMLDLRHLSQSDIFEILHSARALKTKVRYGERAATKHGKNILLLTKSSHITSRIAFEIATRSLEANPIILPLKGSRIDEILSNDESFSVISRFGISSIVVDTSNYFDTFSVAKSVNIPIINASSFASPILSLSATLTLWEKFGNLRGLKVTIVGDFQLTPPNLLFALAKCGVDITVLSPADRKMSEETEEYIKQFGDVILTDEIDVALKNADAVFCYHNEFGKDFAVTNEQFFELCPNAVFMHEVKIENKAEADDDSLENSLKNSENCLTSSHGENTMHVLRAAINIFSI